MILSNRPLGYPPDWPWLPSSPARGAQGPRQAHKQTGMSPHFSKGGWISQPNDLLLLHHSSMNSCNQFVLLVAKNGILGMADFGRHQVRVGQGPSPPMARSGPGTDLAKAGRLINQRMNIFHDWLGN